MKRLALLTSLFVIGSFLLTANAQSEEEKQPVGEYLYKMIESDGVESAVAEYHELKAMETAKYDLGQQQLNSLGYRLLNEEKVEEAVAIFELNAETHPESINVWDSLGEGYFNLGKKDLAEENYQKVLSMLESEPGLPAPRINFSRIMHKINCSSFGILTRLQKQILIMLVFMEDFQPDAGICKILPISKNARVSS